MVSRSVFSVRRLIPQRHTDNDGLDFSDISDADGVNRSANKEKGAEQSSKKQKSGHWTGAKKSSRTKNSPPKPIVIRRSGSIHRVSISSPLPLLPDTPHSSTSSLCSCEHHQGRGQSPRQVPAKKSPGLSSLPSVGSNDQSPRFSSLGYRQRSASSSSTTIQIQHVADAMIKVPSAPESTLDLLEALTIQPDRPATPASSFKLERRISPHGHMRAPSVGHPDDVSENVQQLIRETDKAFEEVGLALSAPIFSPRQSSDQDVIVSPTFTQPRTPPTTAGRNSLSPKLHPRGGPVVLSAPRRKSSVSKPKRKGSKKQKTRLEVPKTKAAAASKHTARWTLAENVSDLLNVRLFNRLEVDEIRTPEQLQAITQKRNSQALSEKARLSSETIRTVETTRTLETDGSETPIEPFHLQDLPQRIGAAGVRLSTLASADDKTDACLSDNRPEAPRREAPPVPSINANTPCLVSPDKMKLKDVPFPALPTKNPLRLLARRNTPPDLASIPELKVTAPEGNTKPASIPAIATTPSGHVSSQPHQGGSPTLTRETDEFLFLAATPFSLTRPSYRHGPIRLAKSDIAALLDTSAAEDVLAMSDGDTLDWTAFQIAIGGGAGDFFSEPNSLDFTTSCTDEDEDAEDTAAWFRSFGFAHAGRLETSPPPPPATPETASPSSSRYSQDSQPGTSSSPSSTPSPQEMQERRREENLPIPVELEVELPPLSPGNNSWSPGDDDLLSVEPERFYRAAAPGMSRWALPGHHKKSSNDASPAGSEDSLPMSPMQDLVMIHGAGSGGSRSGRPRGTVGEGYVVPMGYNLGHDLGDFLRWEAENVYASSMS